MIKDYFSDLKTNDNKKAISDCNECLNLDSTNIKALLRKGQALMDEGLLNEVYNRFFFINIVYIYLLTGF